jgi:major membrane immunogen (membrane-anchored lipoprotein)
MKILFALVALSMLVGCKHSDQFSSSRENMTYTRSDLFAPAVD